MAYGIYDDYSPYGGTQPYSSTQVADPVGEYADLNKPAAPASQPVKQPTTSTPVSSGAAQSEGFDIGKLFSSGQGGGGWGNIAMSVMQNLGSTIDQWNRAAKQEEMLRAMTQREAPFTREGIQGVADLSAIIDQLRHGQLDARSEQRTGADVARRMAARGIGGAAAQLSAQNAVEAARDNYNQWRLDKLSRFIDQRQQLSDALQRKALAERAARVAAAQANADKYRALGRFLGRNILGSIGGFVGSVFGGPQGGQMGAEGGAGTADLIQLLVDATTQDQRQQYLDRAAGTLPGDWGSYYDRYYASGGR